MGLFTKNSKALELQKKKRETWEKLPIKHRVIYPTILILIVSIIINYYFY